MTKKSYWIASSKIPRFARLGDDVKVDIAVIGGGITGVTAAYLLKKAGRTVAVLERDHCAKADTGHTTAHLTYVTDKRLRQLVKDFGRDHAQATWDAGRAAIDQIHTIVEEEQVECGFGWAPGYLHVPWNDDEKTQDQTLQEDAQLARQLGFDASYLASVPIASRAGVRFANQAKFHPLRYLANLVSRIPGDGSHVFEHTEASEVHDDPLGVEANGHRVTCDYVVIATHVPLAGKTPLVSATLLQTKLTSHTSYAIGAHLPKKTAPEALLWDTAEPYRYLRVDRLPKYDFVVFGGEDHKTGQQADPKGCFGRLEKMLAAILPQAKVHYRWSGQVVETNDGLPLMGETAAHQFAATGFAGNGMTFGTAAAMMAVDAALGRKNPWQDLFDIGRTKIKGGAWDYIKENVDYPYYYLKDRLVAAEGESVRSVKRGEGKILKLDGQRVAVYRDPQGRVTTRSAYCTHMGCIVRWNNAEASWDCPCHGSRFKPTGEVLAGPAETPLDEPENEPKK